MNLNGLKEWYLHSRALWDMAYQGEHERRISLLHAISALSQKVREDVGEAVLKINRDNPTKMQISKWNITPEFAISPGNSEFPVFFLYFEEFGHKPFTHESEESLIEPPEYIKKALAPLIAKYHGQGISLNTWMRNTRIREQSCGYSLVG